MFLWLKNQFLFSDLYVAPLYILFIFFICFLLKPKESNISRYFFLGIAYKILGGILFWYLHCLLYKGGDSWAYFYSAKAIGNLLVQDFSKGWLVLSAEISGIDIFPLFNPSTGYPAYYMARDFHTFTVARYSSIICLISYNSFLVATIILSSFSFIGIWKLYRLIIEIYPEMIRPAFFLVIAMPSLLFWGGGIMKDTYVLSAACWFSYNFYYVFIKRKKVVINFLIILFNIVIILNIKSYLLISLIPGALLWLNSAYLKNIKSILIKTFAFPVIILIITLGGFFVFQNISSFMGKYGNVESAIQQAQVIQEDLLREEAYGKNNYNIGEIDGSIGGMVSLAPVAVFTALYRPLPWEIGSPMMVISAIENTILISVTIFLIIRLNPLSFIRTILKEPFVLFSFIYSLIFAFGVGIASTNFGALVRYKIPLMPFFFTAIYILYNIQRKKRNEN